MRQPDSLERFIEAQYAAYPAALQELRAGLKRSHWMWFVFPQLRGLGHSSTSNYYGLAGKAEARVYLDHPILGLRLKEATEAVLAHDHLSVEQIFGHPDFLKFHSCMTLFAQVSEDGPFKRALDRFYEGELDPNTKRLLETLSSDRVRKLFS